MIRPIWLMRALVVLVFLYCKCAATQVKTSNLVRVFCFSPLYVPRSKRAESVKQRAESIPGISGQLQ